MGKITVVVKDQDSVKAVEIQSEELPILVNNIRLYQTDKEFINSFMNNYDSTTIYPSSDGIIIIDTVNNVIMDSQGYTGIYKINATEIKASLHGSIVGETADSNAVKRFVESVDAGKLKGFEEWYDSGTKMNSKLNGVDTEQIVEFLERFSAYGQFVFDTSPYKIEVYYETDVDEQFQLYTTLKSHGYLNVSDDLLWQERIERLQ